MNISKNRHRLFPVRKIKMQLNFMYFTAIFLPLIIIGIFLIVYMSNMLLDHYNNQVQADNIRVKSILFDVTTNIYTISDAIFEDKSLQALLAERYATSQDAAKSCSNYTKLTDYTYKNTSISSIELYTVNPTINDYACFKAVTEEISETAWYRQASSQSSTLWKSLSRIDSRDNTSQELCLIRRIPIISTGEDAVLVIRISNNYLKNRIQIGSLFNIISVNKDPVFYSTERGLSGNDLSIPIDYTQNQYKYLGFLDYKDKDSIASISTLLPFASKDKIYIATIDKEAVGDSRNIIITCIIIVLLASVVPFIIITIFNNRFSSRIVTLRGEMKKASSGDYHLIDNFKGDDELSEVFTSLKIMIESIEKKDASMYEARIQEQVFKNQQQKMEFKMLASQINPHFLYNTLETIRMKAVTAGNRDVANAILLLGKSMHYVLENTGTASTSLKKELDYISTYLAIQKLRFNDRVNYTLTVPEDMNPGEYQILPLLLQPLVENAILHGLADTETDGQIVIAVSKKDDDLLLIDISDNGRGMDEEELETLEKGLQVQKTSSANIGIYNINRRIKLFYGSAYGMEIKSQPNKGTHISLTLPLLNITEDII